MHGQLSDDAYDQLVEHCFHWLPSMDSDELALFLTGIICIIEKELSEQRERQWETIKRPTTS